MKRYKIRKRFWQINQYITAEKVRVVDEEGKQVGVMPTKEALELARKEGLDLVEVAAKEKPPVAKIVEFAKFKYQERRKHLAGKKKSKAQNQKVVRFTPFIAENDFQIRVKRAREFLEEGDKVSLVVKFVGRQITRKEFGYELIKRAHKDLQDVATMEREPALKGKLLITILAPMKKKS
ncbi:translation initiation factor IF-3 [Patescibacteria group bacterium]|nr:translation initiation factor IF-3 [Patescibacteria group bacterium]